MSVDLGHVSVLGADAVGQPGQRRFRLYTQSRQGSAVMWMEKEHLNSLSMALEQFLAIINEEKIVWAETRADDPQPQRGMPADFPVNPTYEFQVGQMKLNYDEQEKVFLLSVTPLEIELEQGGEPQISVNEEQSVSFFFTHTEARELARTIAQVVVAGRPLCPLCHMPMDGETHVCVKQNGHREIVQMEQEEDE